MKPPLAFLLETVSRIGISLFSGTVVSCLILNRLEWFHIGLMGIGLLLMTAGYPLYNHLGRNHPPL